MLFCWWADGGWKLFVGWSGYVSLSYTDHYHRLAKASLEEMKEKTLQLSTNANVISRLTAFVAIDKDSKKKVEGEMMKRSCPVPVATPEFSDALSMNYGQERFRSVS